MTWVQAGHFTDEDNKWNNETYAYDSSDTTKATNTYNEVQHWLGLFFDSSGSVKSVSQIRLKVEEANGSPPTPNVRIEVYDNDDESWVLVYTGTLYTGSWQTKSIPDGPKNITGARINQVTKNGYYTALGVFDFEFDVQEDSVIPPKMNSYRQRRSA